MAGKKYHSLPSLVPGYEQTQTLFLYSFCFFSVPLACVVDHDIARNETWRLISLGHLRVGRPCTACHTLLSYSLHHCGTSVIYIYFIKDKKKRLHWKAWHYWSLYVTWEWNCSQYAFRSGTSTLPSLALLLVHLRWCLMELNDGTRKRWEPYPRTEKVVITWATRK